MRSTAPSKSRSSRSVVPEQFLGFSLQEFRILDHLLRARGDTWVCLEVLGDAGSIRPDGGIVVEETKSRTSRGNPLADRAIDFWKTLRNWSDAVGRGELEPSLTEFHLYVSRRCQPGTIARSFITAGTPDAAAQALREAWQTLEHKGIIHDPLREHVERFFGSHIEIQTAIITRFTVGFGSGNVFGDLRRTALDVDKWASDHKLDDVLQFLLGWVKTELVRLLEARLPAAISSREMNRVARNLVQQLDRNYILISRAPDPTDEDRERQMSSTYIRQLSLIDLDYEWMLRAVNDYLRAEVDRHDWAAEGAVYSWSFDKYEEDLVEAWRVRKLECNIAHSDKGEVGQGKLIFTGCSQYQPMLNGVAPPRHFSSGSYHLLADRRVIGWHPRYSELLDKE